MADEKCGDTVGDPKKQSDPERADEESTEDSAADPERADGESPDPSDDADLKNESESKPRARTSLMMIKDISIVSQKTAAELMHNAKIWFKEVVPRLAPGVVLLAVLGACIGYLLNRASDYLLVTAEANGWHQPWTEETYPGEYYINQTYVRVYAQKHWDWTNDIHAPKLRNDYIGWFWARQGLTGALCYATPFFVMLGYHGWQKAWKVVVFGYSPFALFCIVFTAINCILCQNKKSPFVKYDDTRIIWGVLCLFEALVVIPLLAKYFMHLKHVWRGVIFPFLILSIGLLVLKFAVPYLLAHFESEGERVLFRLTVYVLLTELLEGSTRMLVRFIPLDAEMETRPEDKPFGTIGIVCLCGYWGRIIMNSLNETSWIFIANAGVGIIEVIGRLTVVPRDKFYCRLMHLSKKKGDDFWERNASGMKRFRCSMIYTKFCTEYLMIASAASFYFGSAFVKDKDVGKFIMNVLIQLFSEFIVDGVCAYFEFVREKLPVLQAWRGKNPHWVYMFPVFLLAFQLVAVSLSAENFCALRRQGFSDSVLMTFCPF
jgi:hypothetical protein